MGIFNNHEKKVIAQLRQKSEDICNEITKEINELLDDLHSDYEENKVVLNEFSNLVLELESKLSPEEVTKLRSFTSRLAKVKRCAKKGVESLRELSRDYRKASRETIREYEDYLYV